jgi:hypothetical protein
VHTGDKNIFASATIISFVGQNNYSFKQVIIRLENQFPEENKQFMVNPTNPAIRKDTNNGLQVET